LRRIVGNLHEDLGTFMIESP